VETMSTGQRQRVKLATAIAHDPALVLLDEPTNGLDPVQREQMLALIDKVAHELGIDVVLCSHLLEEVERVSDAVVILDAGRVAATGDVATLLADAGELLVEVDGDAAVAASLVETLAVRGVAARADASKVIVALEADAVFDIVRDTIVDLQLGVRRLERRSASLEDVFLAGTSAP
jgi:ABC-2 type transport system ATP-binding protein